MHENEVLQVSMQESNILFQEQNLLVNKNKNAKWDYHTLSTFVLTWIFISILFLFLCYGLMKICQKYKGVVSTIRLLLGKDPSLIHRTRSNKVSFTKDNEELKFFNTSEGSLTQATSPELRLMTEQFQNQRPEVLLMTEQSQNQRLSENTDSPSAISKQLMYGSKRSLTSEHSYYGKP